MDEKRVIAFIKLGQFFIGSVVVGIATVMINYHIQRREVEIKELEQLGKFIEHAIGENIAARQRFAEYFATVSSSEVSRVRWLTYLGKLHEERKVIEAEKEGIQENREQELDEIRRASMDLERAAARIAELAASSSDSSEVGDELVHQKRALDSALQRQSDAEQRAAALELRLRAAQDELVYPKRAPVQDVLKSGWVYLGEFDYSMNRWLKSYFDIDPLVEPKNLVGNVIQVSAMALNVRRAMPNTFGQNAPARGLLREGASVSVNEVARWSNTGYMWALVSYK